MVAVDHGARGSAASAQAGHLEGVDDQFGAQVVGDGPADDAAGVGVQDDGAVDPALLGAVLGDVGDPQRVRAVGDEPAVDQVCRRSGVRVADGAPALSAPVHADDSVFAHEPLDAFAPDPYALSEAELGVHPWRAVGVARSGVDVADDLDQLQIRPPARGGGAVAPGVVAAGRDAEDPAGHRDRNVVGGELADYRVDHFGRTFSRAK